MCLEKLLATRILPGSAPVPLAHYATLASWCSAYTKRPPSTIYVISFSLKVTQSVESNPHVKLAVCLE